MKVIIQKTKKYNYKYKAIINYSGANGRPFNKIIYFGDRRYEDYTMHKNKQRKSNYIARHKSRENWNNKNTAGFWSRRLLWYKPTLSESAKSIYQRFGIRIIFTTNVN